MIAVNLRRPHADSMSSMGWHIAPPDHRRPRPFFKDAEFEPQIRIDVTEDDKAYKVKADVPGVEKDDIQVEIDGNQVSISAEVKKESEEKKDNVVIRTERYVGRQYRSFSLAQAIDRGRAEAKYSNGVLELTLPKASGSLSARLKVS